MGRSSVLWYGDIGGLRWTVRRLLPPALGLFNPDMILLRKTTKKPPRSLLVLFFCILVSAAVLGGLGIPLVSSEGMVIRTHLIEGDLPTTPEDPAWAKVPPMTLPLSGQVITRPVWPEPTARALSVRSIHIGPAIAFLLEWQAHTKNDRLTPGTFRDGVAIGLPLGDAPAFFCM